MAALKRTPRDKRSSTQRVRPPRRRFSLGRFVRRRPRLTFVLVALLVLGLLAFLSWMYSGPRRPSAEELAKQERRNLELSWEFYERANQERERGNYESAITWFKEALKLRPGNEESLLYLGACYSELGEFREAVKQYRQILDANPDNQPASAQLGAILSTIEPGAPLDYEAARIAIENSGARERRLAEPFVRLGRAALDSGKTDQALSDFETAAGFRSEEALFQIGLAEYLAGRDADAITHFRGALDLSAREIALSGHGPMSAEQLLAPHQDFTSADAAALKSLLFLYWTVSRGDGYPKTVEKNYRLPVARKERAWSFSFTSTPLLAPAAGRSAWADFDRDNDLDLAVCDAVAGLRLYRNDAGELVDVTATVGLDKVGAAWDIVWTDFNGDGFVDLYALRGGWAGSGQNALFKNDRGAAFTDVTLLCGLAGVRSTSVARFFDYDKDGQIDLLEAGNSSEIHGPLRLFRNMGRGRYRDVTRDRGLFLRGNATDCAVGDYDGDGRLDLLVTRWKRPILLLKNRLDGRFADVTARAALRTGPLTSYSSIFWDYDRDGKLDILICPHAPAHLSALTLMREIAGYEPAAADGAGMRLFRNAGDGRFADVSPQLGLNQRYGVMQAVPADFNGDGWTDLALANGSLEKSCVEPSVVLENIEGKLLAPAAYLPGLKRPARSTGVTLVDCDGDGDIDVHLAGVGLFLNQTKKP